MISSQWTPSRCGWRAGGLSEGLNIVHNGRLRVATEDIEVAGQTVRAGEGLIMVNEMGNRDPEVFPEPNRLVIRRDARRHVAFGFGVHQCLGQPLARMELQVVYGTLYRRLPTLKLATELDRVPFIFNGLVYGVHELPVTW
ncbi:MAG TPA: cytochrome P450 [Nonomuraea sp.]|nr:cytochrome P450 [Nonomuraea sp.]